MPRMKLVGLTKVNEGISQKSKEPYKMRDLHFLGKKLGVDGDAVCKVTLDLLNDDDSLPEILPNGLYLVETTDKGYLTNLELLEKPVSEAPVRTRQQAAE